MFDLFIQPVYAQLKSWKEEGGITTEKVGDKSYEVANFRAFEVIFKNLLSIIIILAGIAVFVMLLIGGFGLLTSAGNPEKVKKAGGTITSAVIGLVLLLAIWFIFRFIEVFTGVEVTKIKFPIPSPAP